MEVALLDYNYRFGEHGIPNFLECLTEYAYGAVKGKEGKVRLYKFPA